MGENRKRIPNLKEHINRFKEHRDLFEKYVREYDRVFDDNPEEYKQNKELLEIYNVVLNDLDVCDRNMFIYDWFKSDKKSKDKCKIFGLCVRSYNVYISTIRRKIKEIIFSRK